MERIKHIKETQEKELLGAQTNPGETSTVRDKIEQTDTYDPATETRKEQIAVRETLNSLDEDALKDIFAEYFRKSGSDEETINWIPLEDVRIIYKSPEEEEKSRSPYGDQSIAKGVKLYSHLLWHDPEQTLWTLIHEQCHAISQDRARSYYTANKEGERDGEMIRLKYGVSSATWTKEYGAEETEKKVFDNDINEGITELLTERIFREYKKRTGSEIYNQHPTQPDQTISKTDEIVAREKFNAYERNWQNAKLYIGIISAVTDVPEDVVEHAVIRTYIRNGAIFPFQDSEVNAMLSEVYPKLDIILFNMLESKKGEGLSLKDYVDHLSRQDIPEDVRQKIVTALHKIREEWGEAYKLAPDEV